MPTASTQGRAVRQLSVFALLGLAFMLTSSTPVSRTANDSGTQVMTTSVVPVVVAEVNFTDLARQAALQSPPLGEPRPLILDELEEPGEPGAINGGNAVGLAPQGILQAPQPHLFVASPGPTTSYAGLNDIAMVDSNYIIIPPDVAGGVGLTKVMESFNNNYRIRDKATGATLLTVGTATFWNPVITNKALLNQLTDPRTLYDPYQNRWLVAMQTVNNPGLMLFGVSLTADPAGSWYLYAVTPGFTSAPRLDFPILGFNKNWICMTINAYSTAGAFTRGGTMIANYPQAAAGTLGSVTTITQPAGTHFCSAPAVTYSATEDTLFLVTHLASAGATYEVDRITGTPAAPVYASGAGNVRPGGGWVQPGGNQLPQSAPNAGASACGAPPCLIETSDAQVRTAPCYRNGFLYYTQCIGLPAGAQTHTGVQWTKITPSITPAFVEGGRLEDPTATAINGGLWYSYPSISVNKLNDFMIGFTQYSSAQHPSAGYAFHYGTDAPSSLRDAFIYKAGEDYYHKDFGSGRNRWGDFSTAQVDPCDDVSLWTLQEYGQTRPGTNDGSTGANSSRWASYWAKVAGPVPAASVTCPINQLGTPGGSVGLTFRVTNTGSASGTFNYSVTDAAGWGGPSSGTTPLLAPSSFFDVFVNFSIPSNCSPPSDLVTFTAQVAGGALGCYQQVSCQTTITCDMATPTLVSRFNVRRAGAGVELLWSSEAINEVAGWNLYRAAAENGGWTRLNPQVIPMGTGGDFRYSDADPGSGENFYRLGAVLKDGREEALGSTRMTVGASSYLFAIAGGNPFSGRTTLSYALPRAERVQVSVYDIAGARLRTLVDRTETPGEHAVDFVLREGGRPLGPGVYMVTITAGSYRKTLRLIAIE